MKLLKKETSRDSNIEISKSCPQVPYSSLGIDFFSLGLSAKDRKQIKDNVNSIQSVQRKPKTNWNRIQKILKTFNTKEDS